MSIRLKKGWKTVIFFGSFVGTVMTTLYFTAVQPMIDPEPYLKIREKTIPNLEPKSAYK